MVVSAAVAVVVEVAAVVTVVVVEPSQKLYGLFPRQLPPQPSHPHVCQGLWRQINTSSGVSQLWERSVPERAPPPSLTTPLQTPPHHPHHLSQPRRPPTPHSVSEFLVLRTARCSHVRFFV
ncbi:hypothetical protein E2C01_000156 [Portunus trituberculatus]|uniref:Uncharacterized protein n=1 Tax=Portunus trituberculatus TaxID=210409 RepID=A0A5B7CDB0_PORTR|nr:hypothetical protein [Portunus trituberculatus]